MTLTAKSTLLSTTAGYAGATAAQSLTPTLVFNHVRDIVDSAMRWEDAIAPAQLTANVNDWSPTGYAGARTYLASSDGSTRLVTGLAGGAAGALRAVFNTNALGGKSIVLAGEAMSTASTAANRIAGIGCILPPQRGGLLAYDTAASRWRVLSSPANDGSGLRWFATAAPATTSTRYAHFDFAALLTTDLGRLPVHRPCIISTFGFVCQTSLATDDVTVTLLKNGSATALTFTIPAGTAANTYVSDQAHAVAFDAGDQASVQLVQTGTATQGAWNAKFGIG